jgi:hypothetical protein
VLHPAPAVADVATKLVCCLAALLLSFKAIALSDTELARFSQDFLQCLVAAREARQVLSEVSSDGQPIVPSLNAKGQRNHRQEGLPEVGGQLIAESFCVR